MLHTIVEEVNLRGDKVAEVEKSNQLTIVVVKSISEATV